MSLAAALLLSIAGWTSSGPIGGAVSAVAAAPSDPAVVWAANSSGVFRSTDGGATWANLAAPFTDVSYLVVDPRNANKAWALTARASLFRTADGGATWTDSTGALRGIRPSALLIDPRNPDTLYVGSHCAEIGLSTPRVTPLFHETAGVFKSTDGGATWMQQTAGLDSFSQCVDELAIDPFSPWRLFYAGFGTPAETYDAARTWELTSQPRPTSGVVFDPRYPFTHFGFKRSVDLRQSFLVSQDGGFTWSMVPTELPTFATALSIDPERGRLFLGTRHGIFRSGDGGRAWAPTNAPDVSVNQLDFGGAPAAMFAATGDGLFVLQDRGTGGSRLVDLHDTSADVRGLAVDPADSNIVYAGVYSGSGHGRVFRSTNAGASWERLAGDDDVARSDFLSVDAAGTLYAAGFFGRGVYRRARNDTKWTRVLDTFDVRAVAADPKSAGTVFVAASGGVRRTRDGGATWTHVTDIKFPSTIAIDPSDPRWVYVANIYELLRSSDGGGSWTDVAPFVAGGTETNGDIVVAPSNGQVLYRVAYVDGRLRMDRSGDRAASWQPIPLPNGEYPLAIAVDPRNEKSVWVSGSPSGALYHSTDGGATWQAVATPFATAPDALRFDASGHVLHAGFGLFSGHGVWELTVE